MTDDFIWDESEWHNLEKARQSLGQERDMSRLTDDDRFLIAEARRIGPALRDGGVREQLAAQLLALLADLAELLDGPDDAGG